MRNRLRVLLLGGGTAGHIYPLISVAESLKAQAMVKEVDLDLVYFGDSGNYTDYIKEHDIRIRKIISSKWRRYSSVLNFLDIFKFFWGFIQSLFKVYWLMPDVVFSKSGPGVLPIIYACRFYRIPLVIHETDAVVGKTNLLSAGGARAIEVAFSEAKEYFPEKKREFIKVVGNPVREEILAQNSASESRKSLGLTDGRPVLLVLGGSQGAEKLNYFVLENSEMLLRNFEIIHQIGVGNFDQFKAEFDFVAKNFSAGLKQNYLPFPFLDDKNLTNALNACDLVLSRSGGIIFEIASHAKPAILTPLPDSANNHQQENAFAYQQAGAAIVIEEENLLPNIFLNQAEKILNNKDLYMKMSEAAKNFYQPDSARMIANDILGVALAKGSNGKEGAAVS